MTGKDMSQNMRQKYYSVESGLQLHKSNATWKSYDNCSLFVKPSVETEWIMTQDT